MNALSLLTVVTKTQTAPTLMDPSYVLVIIVDLQETELCVQV